MIILSLFAICAVLAVVIEATKSEAQRKLFTFICFTILALVSGTRLLGGNDFLVYEGHYYFLATFPKVLNPMYVNQNYEIGYTYFASFFKTLGVSFYGFCLIHSIVVYFCLWKGLKRYTNHFGLVILVFLYKLMFYNTMISMRQSLTIAFFLLIIPYIEQKKWLKYYICAFLIAKFHNGAYMLLLLYPLGYIALTKQRIKLLNIIFFPTLFIGFAGIDLMGPLGEFLKDNAVSESMALKADHYFNDENLSPIGVFHTLEYYLIMFLLFRNIKYMNLKNSKVHIVIWMFLCLLPLFTLLRGSEILTREKDYFTIFYAVILGYIADIHPQKRWLVFVGTLVVCTFGYYRYVILFDGGAFLLYKSWLLEPYYSFFLP